MVVGQQGLEGHQQVLQGAKCALRENNFNGRAGKEVSRGYFAPKTANNAYTINISALKLTVPAYNVRAHTKIMYVMSCDSVWQSKPTGAQLGNFERGRRYIFKGEIIHGLSPSLKCVAPQFRYMSLAKV